MPALRPRRRPAIAVLVAAMAFAVAGLAAPAAAQGTSGTLPDPITVSELQRYALQLGLSPAQRQAVMLMHEAYHEEFRGLREGEIAALMQRMRGLQGGIFPDREQVQGVFADVERVEKKIEAIDERFFDRVAVVLDEDQAAWLPRVRSARERRRLTASEMMWMGVGRPPDLSDLVLDLDLDTEARRAVDATLLPYERKLTPRLRELSATTRNTMLAMFDELTARGFDQESMDDPQKAMEIMQAAQEVMRDIARAATERSEAVWSLTSKAIDDVSRALPADARRPFRDAVLQRGYPMVAGAVRYDHDRLARARALDDLTAGQREALDALAERIEIDMDRLARDGRQAMDDWRRDRDMFDMSGQSWQTRQKTAEELGQRGETIRSRFDAELEGILDIVQLTFVNRTTGGGNGAGDSAPEAVAVGTAAETERDDLQRFDLVPTRISEAQARRYAAMMDLDDDRRAIVLGLYQDYLEDFAAIERGEIARVRELEQALGGDKAESSVEPLHGARRAAMQAVRRTDEAFFDAIAETLFAGTEAPGLERARWHRRRVTYHRGNTMSFGFRPSQEANLDLERILRRQRLDDAATQRVEGPLTEWERRCAEALERRWNVLVDAQRSMDRWQIEARRMQAEQGEGEFDWAAWNERYRALFEEVQQQTAESEDAVEAITRDTLTAMVDALGAEDGTALEDAALREAFPQVFADPTAAGDVLTRAMELPTLTDEQRGTLADLAAEYRPEYRALGRRMVEISRTMGTPWLGNDREQWAEFARRQDELARIRFDRSELNGRTIARVRAALTEDQLARVGPLPDLADAQDGRWWQ